MASDGTETTVTPGEHALCVLEISFGGFSAALGRWRWEMETAVCFLTCGFFG